MLVAVLCLPGQGTNLSASVRGQGRQRIEYYMENSWLQDENLFNGKYDN